MPNMYLNPAMIMGPNGPSMTDPRQLQEHFEVRPVRCSRVAGRSDP
jgi:hypothetical protein